MFSSQISLSRLVELCRRVGFSLQAGVDARRTWASEAERNDGWERERLTKVVASIGEGTSLAEALAGRDEASPEGDGYFPPLVLMMVEVGEKSGHLDAVFLQLADHYEHLGNLRSQFLVGLIWPAIQLLAAAAVIALLIFIQGLLDLKDMSGKQLDFLGLGLRGTTGLAIYGAFLLAMLSLGLILWQAIEQGWWGAGSLMNVVMRVPYLGACLEANAMARLSWSLAMAHGAGMDARPTAEIAIRSIENRYYGQHAGVVDDVLRGGGTFTEAFRAAGVFPTRFLDTLSAAEEAGRITEALVVLAEQYREDARILSQGLTMVAGWICWLIVSGLIIMLILRLGMWYVGQINSLIDGTRGR